MRHARIPSDHNNFCVEWKGLHSWSLRKQTRSSRGIVVLCSSRVGWFVWVPEISIAKKCYSCFGYSGVGRGKALCLEDGFVAMRDGSNSNHGMFCPHGMLANSGGAISRCLHRNAVELDGCQAMLPNRSKCPSSARARAQSHRCSFFDADSPLERTTQVAEQHQDRVYPVSNRSCPKICSAPAMGHGRSGLHLSARSKIGRIVAKLSGECAAHLVGVIAIASLDRFARHG